MQTMGISPVGGEVMGCSWQEGFEKILQVAFELDLEGSD